MILGLIFDRCLVDFGIANPWKIDEKSIKKQIKNRCDLGSIFDGSWVGFGVDLGSKLRPSWSQNRSKIEVEKTCNKDDVRELLNVKILGQSGAWELLNVKIW